MRTLLLSLITLSLPVALVAQGCSDAGACSIGASQVDRLNDNDTTAYTNQLTLTQSYGNGENSTPVLTTQLDLLLGFGSRWQAQLRLPYQVVPGDLATTWGVGDLQIAGIAAVIDSAKAAETGHQVWLSLGAKIPPNGADLRGPDSIPLPMVYQPTLGSFDVIPGIRWAWRGLSVAAAYQWVLSTNNNQFSSGNRPDDLDENFHSKELKRGNDIVLQANYQARFLKGKQLTITPGILWIYKHQPDEVQLRDSRQRVEITGSQGTTLNLTLHAGYRFSPRWSIGAQFGMPVIVRDYRTDGLTRSLVAGLQGGWRF